MGTPLPKTRPSDRQVLVEPSPSRRAAGDRRISKLNLVDLAGHVIEVYGFTGFGFRGLGFRGLGFRVL